MRQIAKIITLIKVEFMFDLKKPTLLISAILQLGITALLSMLSQPNMLASVWNSIFWITLLLGSIQSVSKNFTLVARGRWIFWNQIASPAQILWGKIIYGWLQMLLLTGVNLLFFAWFLGIPVIHVIPYFLLLLLVTGGISSIFTFVGAVATKAGSASYMAPVLSLPVIFPLILVGIKASLKAFNPVLVSSIYTDIYLLCALDLLVLVLTGVLFQSLWKD
jgi:heme exporter protein B